MKYFWEKLVTAHCLFFIQTLLILLVRFQLWRKSPEISGSLSSLFSISAPDILLAYLACLLMALLIKKTWVITVLSFILSILLFFPVFFQLKMGLPLSLGLLSQVGGIFELKTSITDNSNFRNIFLFSVIILFTTVTTYLAVRFQSYFRKLTPFILASGFFICLCLLGLSIKQTQDERALSKSFLLQLILSGSESDKISKSALLKSIPAIKVTRTENIPVASDHPNVLMIVLETFDYSLVRDKSFFSTLMPHFSKRIQAAKEFTHHYAPWPFSSKSLYSIICGEYPHPGKVNDLRVRPDINCGGWTTSLNKAGYQMWAGYSGDLAYDRMGDFLNHQATFRMEGRQTLARFKKEEWGLGVDDSALVSAFGEFLEKKNPAKPFSGIFIPINSHHPYWVPSHFKHQYKDPFWASFHYQDQVLEELFTLLEKKDVLKNTIIFVTGDHGKREGTVIHPNVIAEELFHVPLFVFNAPDSWPAKINHATTHLDLKGSILKLANIKGNYLKDYELDKSKDLMVMYDLEHLSFLLKDKNQSSLLLNLDSDNIYSGEGWVSDLKEVCPIESHRCKDQLSKLKGLLDMAQKDYAN